MLSARLVSYMVLAESRAGVARGTEPTPRSAAVHAGLQIYWFYMDTHAKRPESASWKNSSGAAGSDANAAPHGALSSSPRGDSLFTSDGSAGSTVAPAAGVQPAGGKRAGARR